MQDRNVFTRHRTPSGGALEVLLFRNANLLDLLTSPVGNRSLVTTVVRSFVKRSCEPLVIGHSLQSLANQAVHLRSTGNLFGLRHQL